MSKKPQSNIFGFAVVAIYLLLIATALVNKAVISIYYPQLAYVIGILLIVSFIILTRFLFKKRSRHKNDD